MKNRTILGVIFSVLALVIMFVVAPYFTQLADNDIECVRLKSDVLRGTQITAAHLEVVSVPSYAIPTGTYKTAAEVVGQYATSQLYAGDYLTTGKLSAVSISAADVLENLGDGKVAISIPLSSFSGSLSGKLENGDIVQIWVRSDPRADDDGVMVPAELQWVKVVTTTTGDGIDKDQVVVNEDGSFSMPSTVTVVVSEQQAKVLVQYSTESMHIALVYRGDEERCQEYLDMQDAVLEQLSNDQENDEDVNDDVWGTVEQTPALPPEGNTTDNTAGEEG